MKHRVAIVGAGVSGLTCGILFAERGYRTATFAEKTGQRTTSAAAAAIWYPYDAEPIDKVIAWALETYKVLVDLSCKRNTGVSMIELRTFSRRADIQIPEWAIPLAASVIPTELENTASRERRRTDCGSGSRPGRSGETGERIGRSRVKSLTVLPAAFKSGFIMNVPLTDTTIYLDYLTNRFLDAGGRINPNVRFETLEDVSREFDLVIN